eukprot:m.329652 g.329652  ORF g.329652 m.329652 type:complete len:157 (+) comp55602_c0_seq61:405-875(+)
MCLRTGSLFCLTTRRHQKSRSLAGVKDQEESNLGRLWDAVEEGDLALIQQLVAKHGQGILAAQEPDTGYTVIQFAVCRGHANVLEWLLDQGFYIDAPDRLGWTPLMLAAKEGHTELAKMLLERGANMAICDKVLGFVFFLHHFLSIFHYFSLIDPS